MPNEKPPGWYKEQQLEFIAGDKPSEDLQGEVVVEPQPNSPLESTSTLDVEPTPEVLDVEAVVTQGVEPPPNIIVEKAVITQEAPSVDNSKEIPHVPLTTEGIVPPRSYDRPLFPANFPEKAKQVVSDAYEGMYKLPGVSRVVGKLEIAYNNFWINRHEKKNAHLKSKSDSSDTMIAALTNTKSRFEALKSQFESQNRPGIETFDIEMKKIDTKIFDEMNKKDKVQSKLEARDNTIKGYINRRDFIADKLISRYEGRLEPMERHLENLTDRKNQLDLESSVSEMKQKEYLETLEGYEKERQEIAESLRSVGYSERKIKNDANMKFLEDLIAGGKRDISEENSRIAECRARIDVQIAKVDKKANPFRDKREEFVRVKALRPVDFNINERTREQDNTRPEDIVSHPRGEVDSSVNEVLQEPQTQNFEANVENLEGRVRIDALLVSWNEYLRKNKDTTLASERIVQEDFIKRVKLGAQSNVRPVEMKNIFDKYYALNKKMTPAKRAQLQNSFTRFVESTYKK